MKRVTFCALAASVLAFGCGLFAPDLTVEQVKAMSDREAIDLYNCQVEESVDVAAEENATDPIQTPDVGFRPDAGTIVELWDAGFRCEKDPPQIPDV